MRFQTKLMLAMIVAIAVVTVAVLAVTQNKVKTAYSRLFEERFTAQISSFLTLRQDRVDQIIETCAQAAASPAVVNALRTGLDKESQEEVRTMFSSGPGNGAPMSRGPGFGGGRGGSGGGVFRQKGKDAGTRSEHPLRGGGRTAGDGSREPLPKPQKQANEPTQIKEQAEPRPSSPSPGGRRPGWGPGGGGSVPLVALVDPEGEVYPVMGMKRDREDRDRRQALKNMAETIDLDSQELIYMIVDTEEGERDVREIVVTPVRDPDTNEMLGELLVGMSPGNFGERMLTQMSRALQQGEIRSGMLVEGELFSKSIPEPVRAEVVRRLDEEAVRGNGKNDLSFVVGSGGESFRVLHQALNPDSSYSVAYQVALYPLAPLLQDLQDLQLKGSGAGFVALILAIVLGYFISRNLAVPIRALSKGTEEIRRGNFDTRVKVRSKDEVGRLTESFNEMAGELKLKEEYRSVLGKVADEAVVQALIQGSLELGGETREVSVLFCDIRGFTAMTEGMAPDEAIELLNDHMTEMTRIVYEHDGVVDKFVGDQIMAIFGAPKQYGNDVLNALRCGLTMVEERKRLNRDATLPIEIGVGVATGPVVAGCMGSMDRLNYTVVGERVNLASRLCGIAAPMEVVIGEDTRRRVADLCEIETGEVKPVELKGFSKTVTAYVVKAVRKKGLAVPQ